MADETTEEAVEETVETQTEETTAETTTQETQQTEKTEKSAAETTVAAGDQTKETAETEETEQAEKPFWPEDWKERVAKHHSAGDEKAYKREMKRLERLSPETLYGSYRALEARFDQGGLIKVPGKDASDEDVAAFRKAMGYKDNPEDYIKDIKLENGAVIGEADKPVLMGVIEQINNARSPQEAINNLTNWYYGQEEENAAKLDDFDDEFKTNSVTELKEEWGGAFKRNVNAVSLAFQDAPGGSDIKNEKSLMARIMGGRMTDGSKIGDNPDALRWLNSISQQLYPREVLTDYSSGTGKSVEDQIKEIETTMRNDRRAYNKDTEMQARYLELLDAREKNRSRNAA